MAVTETNIHMIQNSSRVVSSLRALAAAAIVFAYARHPRVRSPPNRLIFHRCIAEIIVNFALFLGSWGPDSPRDSALCKIQGILMEWGSTVTLLWSVFMCWSLLLVVYRIRNFATEHKIGVAWRTIVYGATLLLAFALAFVSLPAKGKLFNNAVLWCWSSPQSNMLRYVTSGLNLLVIVIYWLTLFLVARRIWVPDVRFQSSIRILEGVVGRYIITLSAVLAVYGIGRLPFTINFLIGQFDATLSLIQEVFTLAQDLMVCLIFYFTSFVRPLPEEHVWEIEEFGPHDDDLAPRLDVYHKLERNRGRGKSTFLQLSKLGEKLKERPFCRRSDCDSGRLKFRSAIRKLVRIQRSSLGPGPFAGKCWGGDDEQLVSVKFSKGYDEEITRPVPSLRAEDLGFSKKSVPVELDDVSEPFGSSVCDGISIAGTVREQYQPTFRHPTKTDDLSLLLPVSPGLCFPTRSQIDAQTDPTQISRQQLSETKPNPSGPDIIHIPLFHQKRSVRQKGP